MKLLVLLHFYQPYNQQDDILLRIVNECYLPLTEGLLKNPRAKVVININGVLTEMLIEKGYGKVVENIKQLVSRGQVELLGSAMYHAFLPLLPDEEISRQIDVNTEINTKHFGALYKPLGFFSPEMAVADNVIKIISQKGFKWISASNLSHPEGNPSYKKTYKTEGDINVLFREKRISSLMLSGVCKNSQDFIKETTDLHQSDDYWVAVMDAETFGHHRIGHENFLFDVLNNEFFEPVLFDGLIKGYSGSVPEYVSLRPSTWTNDEQDFWLDKEHTQATSSKSFILWKDPENPIHRHQWELTNYIINLVENYPDKNSVNYINARLELDKAISSDQYWWASAKPWWSLEMIEQGAYQLKQVVGTLNAGDESMKMVEDFYRKILDQAFDWQRSGYIRKRHLDNSSTFMQKPFSQRTHAEWYNQIILEFEDEMTKAAMSRDYEKAIKWRDAVLKLSQRTDIYDVLHVVDELWSARSIPSVKPFFDHTWEEFSAYAKQHMLNVASKEDFESWQKSRKRVEPTS